MSRPLPQRHGRRAVVIACVALAMPSSVAAMPPVGARITGHLCDGCVEQVVADSLDSPVAMAVADDGRVFVCEQGGALRVVAHGRLLRRPFVRVPAVATMEQGLVGVALHPRFPRVPYVYVTYTAARPARHNRVVRFTASGDTALAHASLTLLELDPLAAPVHVGGALCFGPDGMLYVGTGDNDDPPQSQDLARTGGKVLRVAPDGAIPADDPFVQHGRGAARAVWARGLRNAFSMSFDRAGALWVQDPGENRWEEVNRVARGGNYGWPVAEGPSHTPGLDDPRFAYDHGSGCCVTGGVRYEPAAAGLGPEWHGRYLYADLCAPELRWFDPADPARHGRLGQTLLAGPVALAVAGDGSLYYLLRGTANPVGGEHSSRGALVRAWRAIPP